ncbi:hypothetical protein CAEBREN_13751 [Caenorhabditis brenneri]|uniref:Uncharacterized protein n=1 Tax=Caenorhabditis brenneri TaxID=135651 RepID=G0MCC2_CAEBE|nr:hypothetical protein CAEBREN_13751 [Caenorhabditis brenneri]
MQHTEASRLELDKLLQELKILLRSEKNASDFFKEKKVKEMIDNVLDKMKIEPGLQKNNGIENLFVGESTKTPIKILIDHFLRQYSTLPKSQIHLHYPGMAPDDRFIPRRPFNLPAFYAHYCGENESMVDTMSRIPEAYHPGLDYINQDVDIMIADHGISVAGPLSSPAHKGKCTESFGTNPHARLESQGMTIVKWDRFRKEFEDDFERAEEKILFHGHHFKLKDGLVIDEKEHYFIKCYLNNNEMSDDLTIRKIQFHGSEDVQVLVLFEQWFMAVGRLRKRSGVCKSSGENPFYLDLVEVVGSFGTTDFYTSPGFKTVLRICCYQGDEEEEEERDLKRAKELIAADINQLIDNIEPLYEKMKENENPRIIHPESSDEPGANVLDHYCYPLSLLLLVYQTYQESPNLDDFDFDSPRERLDYAFYILQKNHERSTCREGSSCENLKKFFEVCRGFVLGFEAKAKTSAMDMRMAEQFRQTLSMLYAAFRRPLEFFDQKKLKLIECVLNPPKLYSLDANFVYLNFLLFPRYIRPMLLDILCRNEGADFFSNELPSNHHLIHHIYNLGDCLETEKLCKGDVLKAMKRHPHVILFSTNPKMPNIGLVKQLGRFWDKRDSKDEDSEGPGSRIQLLGSGYRDDGSMGSTGSTDSGSSDSDMGFMDLGIREDPEREGSVEKVEAPRRPSGGSPVEDRSSEEPEERDPPAVSTEQPSNSGLEGRTPNKRAGPPVSPHEPVKMRRLVVEVAVVDRLAGDFEHGETSQDDDTTTDEPSPTNTMDIEDDNYGSPPPVSTEPCSSKQAYRDEPAKDNNRTPTRPPVSTEPCSSKQAYRDEPAKDNNRTPTRPPVSTEPCSSKQAYGDEPVKAQKTPMRLNKLVTIPKDPKPPGTPDTPTRKRPGSPYRSNEPEEKRDPARQGIIDWFDNLYYPDDKTKEVPAGQQAQLYQQSPARPPRNENPELKSPSGNTRSHDCNSMSKSLYKRRKY